MKDILSYIKESVESGFRQNLTIDEVRGWLADIKSKSGKPRWSTESKDGGPSPLDRAMKFLTKLHEYCESNGIEPLFLYSKTENYIKIPYDTLSFIRQYPQNVPGEDGVYWVQDPVTANKVYVMVAGKKLAETGKGRYGSKNIPTAMHEYISTVFFNTYIPNEDDREKLWLNINALLMDKYSDLGIKSWLHTWWEHGLVLRKKFRSKNMRAVWRGDLGKLKQYVSAIGEVDGIDSSLINFTSGDSKINDIYNKASEIWKQYLIDDAKIGMTSRTRVETFDKPDILIYDTTKVREIIDELTNIPESAILGVLRVLFQKDMLMGISLKQLASTQKGTFELEEYNVSTKKCIDPITDIEVKDPTSARDIGFANDFTLYCISHNLATDKDVKIDWQMRSFNGIDADVKYPGKPSFGKCPKFMWMDKWLMPRIQKSPAPWKNITAKNMSELFTMKEYKELAKAYGWKVDNKNIDFHWETANHVRPLALQFYYVFSKLFINGKPTKEALELVSSWIMASAGQMPYAFPFLKTEEV